MHEQANTRKSDQEIYGLMRASLDQTSAVAPTDQVRHELTEAAHSYPSTNLLTVDRAGRRMLSLGNNRH
jgi:hypothetical protein